MGMLIGIALLCYIVGKLCRRAGMRYIVEGLLQAPESVMVERVQAWNTKLSAEVGDVDNGVEDPTFIIWATEMYK